MTIKQKKIERDLLLTELTDLVSNRKMFHEIYEQSHKPEYLNTIDLINSKILNRSRKLEELINE